MKKYIKQLEKVIDKKMKTSESSKEEQQDIKGFMARQTAKTETTKDMPQQNIMDVVADLVISIRKQRMEYKNAKEVS
jgi:flagellar biosynthesis protein FliP